MLFLMVDDMEAIARSTTRDLLYFLAAAKEDTRQVHLTIEALLQEKDEATTRAAHAVVVELNKTESRTKMLRTRREVQTAMEMMRREMEKMHSAIESTSTNVKKVFHKKAQIAREKGELEALMQKNQN